MTEKILDFINRRFSVNCDWTNGNCYWFALILTHRFPSLQIYYLPITGHFVAGDDEFFYDWNGIIPLSENPILLEDLKSTDFLWYNNLMRDCCY